MKKCLDCGSTINKEAQRCKSCSRKGTRNSMWGKRGERSPFWGRKLSPETKQKISESRRGRFGGENHPNWKGGRVRLVDSSIMVWKADHPHATGRGYVYEHRLIMEKILGRFLTFKEVIHHINGIKDDNRKENLMLFPSSGKHNKYHARLRRM